MGGGSGTDGVEPAAGAEELEEEEPAPLHSLQMLAPKPRAPRAASERQLPVLNRWNTLEPKDIVRDLVELGIVHHLEVAGNLISANNKYKENNSARNRPGSYMAPRLPPPYPPPPPPCFIYVFVYKYSYMHKFTVFNQI